HISNRTLYTYLHCSMSLIFVDISPYSFFFNDTAPTEIYTLSLHDALPISDIAKAAQVGRATLHRYFSDRAELHRAVVADCHQTIDRKSTRLNSSHVKISYAVFCLKKKKKKKTLIIINNSTQNTSDIRSTLH